MWYPLTGIAASVWIIGTILLLRFWASYKLAKNGSGRAVKSRLRRTIMRCVFWPIWVMAIVGGFIGHLLLLACIGKKAREALKRNGK
jgi:hypothetical protein